MSDELDDGGPPLPAHLRAALLVEGLDGDPGDDARVRMAARLAGALGIAAAALLPVGLGGGGVVGGAVAAAGGAGAAGAAAGAAGGGAAAGAAGGVIGAKAVGLAIGALVVGGAVGVTVSELRPRHTETRAITSPPPRAPSDASIDALPIDAAIDAPDIDAPPVDAPPATRRDAAPADAAGDTIARERELIDVARSAIRAKDLRLATKQLVEHELRFPAGSLAEERQVLVIEVALTKGDHATVVTRASEFLAAHPSSVFRRRVEEMLEIAAERR